MQYNHDEANVIPFPKQERPQDTHEPLEVFAQLAADVGLIRPDDKLDQNMVDFAFAIVAKCASIGDEYPDHQNDGSAGEHIRAILGEA